MAKQLIVNADDYNTDRQRNEGIIHAAENGIVTSTTVLSNMLMEDGTCEELIMTFKDGIGVHLNLTWGMPITKGLRTVVDSYGRFLPKKRIWQKAFLRQIDLQEAEAEFCAQILRLKEAGIIPDHIDGNNHIHVFPGLSGVVAKVAGMFGISRIRRPFEKFFSCSILFNKTFFKKFFMALLSTRAGRIFSDAGMISPDCFAGIQYPVTSSIESVRAFLRNMPDGITELMCHPGYEAQSGNPFSNKHRREELLVLTHPLVMKDITDLNIQLTSYSSI